MPESNCRTATAIKQEAFVSCLNKSAYSELLQTYRRANSGSKERDSEGAGRWWA
ncbi:MAG: hypothetical protein Q3M30_03055 [Candidatus Electrothrix sp. Rat3]|nr:hypothetical protein [Candidatus Electrothrix rattekaaiensis]